MPACSSLSGASDYRPGTDFAETSPVMNGVYFGFDCVNDEEEGLWESVYIDGSKVNVSECGGRKLSKLGIWDFKTTILSNKIQVVLSLSNITR